MDGPVVGYDAAGLRGAAGQHTRVVAACGALRDALAGATVVPAAFGALSAVEGFVAALNRVRDGQVHDAGVEADRRIELAGRTARTAAQGDQLTTESTRAAASARGR